MPDPISWTHAAPYLLTALAFGYLLGSVPFGLVLTRLAGLGDIRTIGSGNIGATNVLRTGNKPLALATLILDSGKGGIAVLLAASYGPDTMVCAGVGAMLGHTFPVWLGFKGGKGVATALGTLLALSWPIGLIACGTWLGVAMLFRISSLSALVALATAPMWAWGLGLAQIAEVALAILVLVAYRHRGNIERLVTGQEPKMSFGHTNNNASSPGDSTENDPAAGGPGT